MMKSFRKKTLKLRYGIVRLITPGLLPVVHRPAILSIKGNNLVGVEIGVACGVYAKMILESLNIKKLYLIDPYKDYVENNKLIPASVLVDQYVKVPSYSDIKNLALKNLKYFSSYIQFIPLESEEAVVLVPDNLDFVYIDGNHDYEHVKSDIKNYYPKVKKGGIIGGHDFNEDSFGVLYAVLEFARANNLNLHAKNGDWWVQKGKFF